MTVKRADAVNQSSPLRNNSGSNCAKTNELDVVSGEKASSDRAFYGKQKACGCEIEADQESTGSSEDMESSSPRSVVARMMMMRKWPNKNGNYNNYNNNSVYVHNQILRIREEDSHSTAANYSSLDNHNHNHHNYNYNYNYKAAIVVDSDSDDEEHRVDFTQRPMHRASPLSGNMIKSMGH